MDREEYMLNQNTRVGVTHTVVRCDIFESVVSLYTCQDILNDYPLRIQFQGEKALDYGGVRREMFSSFFEEMYRKLFDGNVLLTPVVHLQIELCVLTYLFVVCYQYG